MEEARDDEKVYLREWYVFLRYNRDRVKVLVRGRREVERGVLDQEPWQSSPIVRRLSPREVITKRGSCYVLVGPCDERAAKASGVSSEIIDVFRHGFDDAWKRIVMDMAFSWKQESTDTRESPAAQVTKNATTTVPKLPNTLEFVDQDHDELFSQPVPTRSPVISEPLTPRTREVGCEAQPHQIVNIEHHLDILNSPEHANDNPPTPEGNRLSAVQAGIVKPVPDTRANKEGLVHPLASQPLNAEDVTNSMSKTNGVSGKGSSGNSRRSSQISKKDSGASRNENVSLKLKVHDSANSSYSAPTYVALDNDGLTTNDQAPGVEINSMPLSPKSPARDEGSSTQDDDEELKAVDALPVLVAVAEASKDHESTGTVLVPRVPGAASPAREKVSQIGPVLGVETGTNSAASRSAKTGPTGAMTREQDIEPRAKLRPRRGSSKTQLLVGPKDPASINPEGSYRRKALATGVRGDQSVDNATETSTSVGKGSGKKSAREDGSPAIEEVSRKGTLVPSSSHQSTVEIEGRSPRRTSIEDNKNVQELHDNADTPEEQKRTTDTLPTPPKPAEVDKRAFKPSEGTSSVKTQDSKMSMQKVNVAARESPPKRSRRTGNRELERLRTKIDYSVFYLPGPTNHRRESLSAGNGRISNAPSSEAHVDLSKGSGLSSGGVSRSRKRPDRKMQPEETVPQKQESELISADSSLLNRAGVRTSRSGRVIMPVLEYWRNQTVRRGVLGIEDIEDPSNEMLSGKKRRYSELKVRRKLFHDSTDGSESPIANGQDLKDTKPEEQGNEKHRTNRKRRKRQTIG